MDKTFACLTCRRTLSFARYGRALKCRAHNCTECHAKIISTQITNAIRCSALYKNGDNWTVHEMAGTLGLDTDKVKGCVSSMREREELVKLETAPGSKSGECLYTVKGTKMEPATDFFNPVPRRENPFNPWAGNPWAR